MKKSVFYGFYAQKEFQNIKIVTFFGDYIYFMYFCKIKRW